MKHTVHLLQDDETSISTWLRRSEYLHRMLRPTLPADYEGYLRRMFSQGAQMAVLHQAEIPKALTVYRVYHMTFNGCRFYVDDLVTLDNDRGKGFGAALLQWCENAARAQGCDTFALDSGVQRIAAHRFYFRLGLESSTGEEPLRLQSDTGFSHRLGWYPCNLGKNETA